MSSSARRSIGDTAAARQAWRELTHDDGNADAGADAGITEGGADTDDDAEPRFDSCGEPLNEAARLALAEIDKDTSGSSLLLSPALPPRSDREVASMHYERVMEQLRRSSTDGAEQHNDSSRLFANLAQIGSPEGAQQLTEL